MVAGNSNSGNPGSALATRFQIVIDMSTDNTPSCASKCGLKPLSCSILTRAGPGENTSLGLTLNPNFANLATIFSLVLWDSLVQKRTGIPLPFNLQ